MAKVTIHMVSSLDGVIAKKDNSVSWFETQDHYDKGVELSKEDMERFLQSIDCYVMGANTYQHALELSKTYGWAYGDIPTIVVTHQQLPIERTNIELHAGDLVKLINEQLKPAYNNIWLVGGSMLTKEFIRLNLVDEIRVSVLPILLGEGTLFFNEIGKEQALHLKDVTAYKSGMVELCYEVSMLAL